MHKLMNGFTLLTPKYKYSLSDNNSVTWPIDLQRNSYLAGAPKEQNTLGGVFFCPLKTIKIESRPNKQVLGLFSL